MVCPVIKLGASEGRKAMIPTKSSGPSRIYSWDKVKSVTGNVQSLFIDIGIEKNGVSLIFSNPFEIFGT